MPSDKKRINLTIPDEIYERLQAYKNETGIVNDATACLQLIVQQLNAHANNKAVLHFLQNSTLEQLQQAANEGAAQISGTARERHYLIYAEIHKRNGCSCAKMRERSGSHPVRPSGRLCRQATAYDVK